MPFLTDIDARAAIKGSRDPLAAQAIWTLLGRHVVGGLTTNTTSVRDFVVLLLGHWFIRRRTGTVTMAWPRKPLGLSGTEHLCRFVISVLEPSLDER